MLEFKLAQRGGMHWCLIFKSMELAGNEIHLEPVGDVRMSKIKQEMEDFEMKLLKTVKETYSYNTRSDFFYIL